MKIERFVRTMLPNFEKRRVLEDLRGLIAELDEVVVPSYKKATGLFRNGKFNNKDVRSFEDACRSDLSHFKVNHVQTIHRSLKMAQANAEAVSVLIKKGCSSDIMRDGITYLIANQLQFIEVATFVSAYARRWLIFLFSVETKSFDERNYAQKSAYLRELDFLKKNRDHFINGLRIVSRNPEKLEKALDEVPDVVVDLDRAEVTGSVLGSSRVDPLKMGLIPVSLNPVFYIRVAIAEWQTHQYHLLREEAKQLELRLLFMKQDNEGRPDTKVQQQIEYSQERMEKLRFKLHRMENPDG